MAVLSWSDWSPDQEGPPKTLTLAQFFPMYLEATAPVGVSRMSVVVVEGLSLSVAAHCKAADQHLSVIGETPSSLPQFPSTRPLTVMRQISI